MNARKFGGLMELCGHFSKQDSYAVNVRQPLPDTPCRTHCIYMLRLQHHKCHHCRKTQDAPQLVSASVPIKASDLYIYVYTSGRPCLPSPTKAFLPQ